MLKQTAFANAVAILSGIFYILFTLLKVVAPTVFVYFFNAQFLGADVASLLPPTLSFGAFLGTLIVLLVFGWLIGYVLAWLYNRFAS